MLVIDAYIAIKLVTFEPGRVEASDRVAAEAEIIAPDWILIECGHALWRKVKMGLMEQSAAMESLETLPSLFEKLAAGAQLTLPAQKLAFELDHWTYDCIYLALALDQDSKLLTADRKFWNAAKRAGYEDSVELLSWEDA